MKKNLLERIIRTMLFEQSEVTPIEYDPEDIPVKITLMNGADKTTERSEYEDAGAVYGFDVKVIAKKFKPKQEPGANKQKSKLPKERASEDVLFKSINDTLKQPQFAKVASILNSTGMYALISGDYRPSARVFSFRCWVFDADFFDAKWNLPFLPVTKTTGGKDPETGLKIIDTGLEDIVTVYAGLTKERLGNAAIMKFEDGKWYAETSLLDLGLNQKNADPKGLKQYEEWYNKLRKINGTLPTVDFKFTDISKLPEAPVETPYEYTPAEKQYYVDIDGKDVAIPSKLENEEIIIRFTLLADNLLKKFEKTFLFTGDILDDKYEQGIIQYIGSVTDPITMNKLFIGTIQGISYNYATDELQLIYRFWQGTITDFKFWEEGGGIMKDYLVSGDVENGVFVDSATITKTNGKTNTWKEYIDWEKSN